MGLQQTAVSASLLSWIRTGSVERVPHGLHKGPRSSQTTVRERRMECLNASVWSSGRRLRIAAPIVCLPRLVATRQSSQGKKQGLLGAIACAHYKCWTLEQMLYRRSRLCFQQSPESRPCECCVLPKMISGRAAAICCAVLSPTRQTACHCAPSTSAATMWAMRV